MRLWNGKAGMEILAKLSTPHYADDTGKEPRYYQRLAIQSAVEDIQSGNDRGLLVMATGAGKTYVASQIVHRLKSAKLVSRVLSLPIEITRLIKLNQEIFNFWKHPTRITRRNIDPAFEVYTRLYQAISLPTVKRMFTENLLGFL